MEIRKQPVKTTEIPLKDAYEGWKFTARTNPPIKAFGHIASGNFERIVTGLSKIIIKWNFVDEEGKPLSEPTEDTIGDCPLDLITMVSQEYMEEITKLPQA